MVKTKISVIVPVYNVEKYIDKCVQSILNQTYNDFELILVNDGSIDSSYDHLMKYSTDNRVTIINKENTGQSDSRYQGLLNSNGDYVFYVDSDDAIEKDALEVFAEDIQNYESDVVFSRYRLVDEEGKELRRQAIYDVRIIEGNEQIIRDSLCVKNFKASLCLKVVKRELLINCFNEKVRSLHVNEDVFLSFLLSTCCNKVTFRNEILYNVLQRKDSLSRSIKPELITINDTIFNNIRNILTNRSLFNKFKTEFYRGYTKSVLYALAVSAIHAPTYNSFHSMYILLDINSIYYSQDLRENINMITPKYRFLYHIGKYPWLYYHLIRMLKKSLQY